MEFLLEFLLELLVTGVDAVDLRLEELGEVGSLGLQGGREEAVLNGELLWVEVEVFHLGGGQMTSIKRPLQVTQHVPNVFPALAPGTHTPTRTHTHTHTPPSFKNEML